jgi:hypothetical protein
LASTLAEALTVALEEARVEAPRVMHALGAAGLLGRFARPSCDCARFTEASLRELSALHGLAEERA